MVMDIGQHRIRVIDVMETDNAKSADYPLRLIVHIPEETAVIERLELLYWLRNFRAYTKATAAGSAHTHNLNIGVGGAHTHPVTGATSSGGGGGDVTHYTWFVKENIALTYGVWTDIDTENIVMDTSFVLVQISVAASQDNLPNNWMYLRVYDGTNYYPDEVGAFIDIMGSNTEWYGDNAATILVPGNMKGKTLTLQVRTGTGTDLEYDFVGTYNGMGLHTHTVTGQTAESATHSHPGEVTEEESAHTHDMTYDIYEQAYSNPSISIRIDGVDRTSDLGGPFTADAKVIDISDYVTTAGVHVVDIIPNQLIGITGHVYGRVIVGFPGEVGALALGRYNYSFYNRCVYS